MRLSTWQTPLREAPEAGSSRTSSRSGAPLGRTVQRRPLTAPARTIGDAHAVAGAALVHPIGAVGGGFQSQLVQLSPSVVAHIQEQRRPTSSAGVLLANAQSQTAGDGTELQLEHCGRTGFDVTNPYSTQHSRARALWTAGAKPPPGKSSHRPKFSEQGARLRKIAAARHKAPSHYGATATARVPREIMMQRNKDRVDDRDRHFMLRAHFRPQHRDRFDY